MDSPAWHDALTRIQVEYVEMPDLKLTMRQVGRLCDLPPDLCAAALAALVRVGFLFEAQGEMFLRRGPERPAADPIDLRTSDVVLGPPSLTDTRFNLVPFRPRLVKSLGG